MKILGGRARRTHFLKWSFWPQQWLNWKEKDIIFLLMLHHSGQDGCHKPPKVEDLSKVFVKNSSFNYQSNSVKRFTPIAIHLNDKHCLKN